MLHIAGVFGEWEVKKKLWKFNVNTEKGGKLFTVRDGFKFGDMVRMVQEDFGIDRLVEVELSYMLPETMLKDMPKDTPPVFVTNDRQLDTLCEICRSMPVRLCISHQNVNLESRNQCFNSREIANDSNDETEVEAFKFHDRKAIEKGQWYNNKAELSWNIRMLSIERKFRITVKKSDTKLLVVKCVDGSCKWMVRAAKKDPSCEFFWVTKYINQHTCLYRRVGAPKASSKVISKLLLENFGKAGLDMKPDLISTAMKKRYGLDAKYWKIWKSREDARLEVLGSPESSYAQLPVYIHKLKMANPGTITCLEVDDQDRFKYMFLSFGASAKGYEFMRKVVVVDGTFLKGKYPGTLLVATAQDGDSHVYPLAFGIVDSENDASWEWFFTKLKSVVEDDPRLVMISDRHCSIGEAIKKVYPSAHHGICTYHLLKNVTGEPGGRKVRRLVKTASKAYTRAEFNVIFAEIRRQNKAMGVYLEKANALMWSRAYFPGDKYDITTSNSAESINSVFRKPCELPIVSLIEAIRNTLTRWFFERRESGAKLTSSLTPRVEKEIEKRCGLSSTFDVQPINQYEFQVIDGS